ncbi:ABC transporter permease [Planctomycetota bacterium]
MYKIILAFRYLLRRRITYLAVAAVALCVFMVVVVMTVMRGLSEDFKVHNHDWAGDCVISSDSLVGFPYYEEFIDILEEKAFVRAVSPAIKSYGLLKLDGSQWSRNVEIMGIDPQRHSRATGFGQMLYYHKDDPSKAFEPTYDANLPGCIRGIDQVLERDQFGHYKQYQASPEKSYSISCFPLTAKGAFAKGGLELVNTKQFYYSDNLHSRLARIDGSYVYLPFADAQKLCGMAGGRKRIHTIHIKFAPDVKLTAGTDQVRQLWRDFAAGKSETKGANLLDKVRVESWKGYRRATIAAVEKEQVMMTAAFCMIGIITVFIVFVIFYMIVSHKSKDIGILRSVGVTAFDIVQLFLGFGFLIGLIGSTIGTAGAVFFLAQINNVEQWLYENFGFQLWTRTIYAIDQIPNKIEIQLIAVVVIAAIGACLLGAAVPSTQAARARPVETLQVNQL